MNTMLPARDSPISLLQKQENEKQKKTLPPQKEMLILWLLRGSGTKGVYGLDIQRGISECSEENESISIGSLYSLLKRLRRKGYIESYEGDALGGGAKRHYYYLTERGQSIVQYADSFFIKLQNWKSS